MPYRLGPGRTKLGFVCNSEMPRMIFRACQATGTPSLTRYIQQAICAALARDLGESYEDLVAKLPPGRSQGIGGFNAFYHVGPQNTDEYVR